MPENNNNAKYAFYYLLSLAALIFTALGVGLASFGVIDRLLPDAAFIGSYVRNASNSFKFAISSLLIAAPLFYFLSSLINRGLKQGDLKLDSAIRRWLTYFILLVTSLTILGIMISIINSFLSGEITARFIFKVLTIFIISGLTFVYYYQDIRREEAATLTPLGKGLALASLILVVISFIAPWFFIEAPKEVRARRMDEALVNKIRNLEAAVNSYYDRNDVLPADSEALKLDQGFNIPFGEWQDPETGALIEYRLTSTSTFEFCAEFRTNSFEENDNYIGYAMSDNKGHKSGYQCVPGILWNIKTK